MLIPFFVLAKLSSKYFPQEAENNSDSSTHNEYENNLKGKTATERREHLLNLWRKVYNMLSGVVIILHQSEAVNTKIHLFGRQLIGLSSHFGGVQEDEEKISRLVIQSQSKFRLFWNLLVIGLLLYTSLFVPL